MRNKYKQIIKNLETALEIAKSDAKFWERLYSGANKVDTGGTWLECALKLRADKAELQKQYDELYKEYIDLLTKHEMLLGIRKEGKQ